MIETQFSGDKQGAPGNVVFGRGTSVYSEAVIPDSVMRSVLKVSVNLGYAANAIVLVSAFNVNILIL